MHRRYIAALFLALYLPVSVGVAFLHSHAVIISGDQHQVVSQHEDADAVAVPDGYCIICKFISSQSIPGEPRWNSPSSTASVLLGYPQAEAGMLSAILWDGRAPPFAG